MNPFGRLKYAYAELREHYDDPVWVRGRLTQRLVRPIHRYYPGDGDAIQVMDEDWDTLVVLDACRADLFESVADIDRFDSYTRRTSAGSMTREWTQRNFGDGRYGDTVYVSANPYTSTEAGDSFHELRELWRDGFDDEERTVLPGAVLAGARAAYADHPDKRLVVHFMQPHYPFIGYPELRYQSWDPSEIVDDEHGADRPHDPWQALEMGLADRADVWEAYAENLKLGLDAALELAAELDGRTVITSDHGNMLGERAWPVPVKLYGHPEGVRHPTLVDVPWAVIEGETRREVTDEGVTAVEEAASDVVEDRLRNLGYA